MRFPADTKNMKSFDNFCAHSIIICAALIALGPILIAGWLPPLSANMGAQELKAIFVEDHFAILIAMTLCGLSGMFYTLFGSAIATVIERMSPGHASLARVQFSMAAATGIVISLLGFLGLALAFRTDIDVQVLRFGADLWWLTFVGWYCPALWQYITIAWAIFSDSEQKLYPRWVGYLNMWVSLSLAPGLYMAFFHDGPFAWHGIFGFWLVAFGFFAWSFVMWRMTLKALNALDYEN